MQRVAIARALVNDPEILLAEAEPAGALRHCASSPSRLMDLLTAMANAAGSCIMVTHNPELADQYSHPHCEPGRRR